MTTELATLSIAVLMEDGIPKQISTSSNFQDYLFWRSILDQVWVSQVKGQASSNAQVEVGAQNVDVGDIQSTSDD